MHYLSDGEDITYITITFDRPYELTDNPFVTARRIDNELRQWLETHKDYRLFVNGTTEFNNTGMRFPVEKKK